MYFIHDQYVLLLTMVGVGIAWASILSMPYAILSSALPPARMGVYMGVFNFFIVIPEIIASLGFGPLTRAVFGRDNPAAPLYTVMLGGVCLLVAAACVSLVDDTERFVSDETLLDADRRGAVHDAGDRCSPFPGGLDPGRIGHLALLTGASRQSSPPRLVRRRPA